MRRFVFTFRRFSLHLTAILIAIALWLQVHGQGEVSVSIDVPLQVHGLPAEMMIVNDLPDHVRLTVKGLQSRLKDLRQQTLTMPIDASDISTPGVVVRALQLSSASLPVGLHIEKIQPDRLELQVDRLITRSLPVHAHFELPEGWQATAVTVDPKQVEMIGPEVWLDSLREVKTTPIRPKLISGSFESRTGVESSTGKSIRLADGQVEIEVKGILIRKAAVLPLNEELQGDQQ